jgi:hypothetical protein
MFQCIDIDAKAVVQIGAVNFWALLLKDDLVLLVETVALLVPLLGKPPLKPSSMPYLQPSLQPPSEPLTSLRHRCHLTSCVSPQSF